jgi:uncharacterized membrane protein SpoIIM required for sporulation
VDIDRYIARHEPTWRQLEDLTGRARGDLAKLAPGEVEGLVQLYQRTSAHLSYARTYLHDQALIARLTRLVATANGVIYSRRVKSWRTLIRFFTHTYPGAVYHYRRFVVLALLAFYVPALLLGIWLSADARALDASATRKERVHYIEDQFSQYYSDRPAPEFFAQVTVNNIQVSFLTFAAGAVTGGLGSVAFLVENGAPLGILSAWMIADGDIWKFLGYVLPHGATELTAIIIAGAAGMAVGWSYISPGDRTRLDALRDAGQRSVTIVMGLVSMFVLAGLIEGFITGSGLETGLRVGIGAAACTGYVTYLVTRGRAAAAEGVTGLLFEKARDWQDEPDRWIRANDALAVPGRLV